jgi:hypothetical protein
MVEAWQDGFAIDDNGIVLWVPTIADVENPTAQELTAAGVIRLTGGLTPDGFSHTPTVNKVTSGRYARKQTITYDGTISDEVVLRYVYNRTTPTAVEEILSVTGVDGNIVHILGYPNDHVIAAGTKVNAVIPVTTSVSVDIPATANTEAFKETRPNVRAEVAREVEVVAGV